MTVLDDLSESTTDLLFAALDYAMENAALDAKGSSRSRCCNGPTTPAA